MITYYPDSSLVTSKRWKTVSVYITSISKNSFCNQYIEQLVSLCFFCPATITTKVKLFHFLFIYTFKFHENYLGQDIHEFYFCCICTLGNLSPCHSSLPNLSMFDSFGVSIGDLDRSGSFCTRYMSENNNNGFSI